MTTTPADAGAFIQRWQGVTASELSTSQSFVIELCELLDVPRPHATDEQDYMFERSVTFQHGDGSTSAGRIDCYRRGGFIWESKKLKPGVATAATGSTSKAFDDALLRARAQAEAYAAEGHFGAGSMGPKIEALLAFVKGRAGGRGVITNAENIERALRGETGTWIES